MVAVAEDLQQGQLLDRSRSGIGVAAAAELGEDLADVDLGNARTADQEDPLPHAHRHQQGVEVLHVLELVG